MSFSPENKAGGDGDKEAVGIIGMVKPGIDQPDEGLEIEERQKDNHQRDSDNLLGIHISLSLRLLKYSIPNRQRRPVISRTRVLASGIGAAIPATLASSIPSSAAL